MSLHSNDYAVLRMRTPHCEEAGGNADCLERKMCQTQGVQVKYCCGNVQQGL